MTPVAVSPLLLTLLERSIPAVKITKVIPKASRPIIDTWRNTLKILIGLRNAGSKTAKMTQRTIKKRNAPNRLASSSGSKRLRATDVVAADEVAVVMSYFLKFEDFGSLPQRGCCRAVTLGIWSLLTPE